MIGAWSRPRVRVTHMPSGESVTVELSDRRRLSEARLADPLNPGEWLQ